MAFFTNLTKEGVQVSFGFVGLEGPKGSGKSTTAGLLAAGISAEFCGRAPVAFLDSEKGANFVVPMFQAEKIDLLHVSTRSIKTLRQSIIEAKREGACVLLIDSMTTFWRTLVRVYMEEHRITSMKFMMPHWTAVKEPWFDMLEELKDESMHKIICGRGGFEFEEIDILGDDGEVVSRDSVRGDHKMKGEGELGHEPDILVHMESMVDPAGSQGGKAKRGKKGKVQLIAPRKIHVATIEKGRVWALNGKVFTYQDRDAYAAGEYKEVLDDFLPYFKFLNLGGKHQKVATDGVGDSFRKELSNGEYVARRRRCEIAVEEIKGALGCVWGAATGKDAQAKTETINALFGTHSWTAVEKLHVEALEAGAHICRRMKDLAILAPPTDRQALLALVSQARDEIRDEMVMPVAPPPVITGVPEYDQDMPF